MINLTNLCLKFTKEYYALYNINLTIEKGERVCLFGQSESGKTSILRTLAGLEKEYTGDAFINNKDLKTIVYSSEDYEGKCDLFVKTEKAEDSQKSFKHIMNFVNLCEKCVFEGDTIVVLTDEADFVGDVIDSLDEEVSNRTKKHLQSRINEFLALGNALIVYKLDKDFIYQ